MADEVDQGSLATDTSDAATQRDEFVADERGLPDSPANDNPLPLEAIDTMVNKAEGDHEALAENAYQSRIVDETDGVSFNGLTSVEEQALEEQRGTIREEAPGATTGPDAATPPDATGEPTGPDATESARALATERGIDLADVTGTGKDGRITRDDVEGHTSA